MPVKKQVLEGQVESANMPKTVVVKVTVRKRHPKYHKQYSVSKRYKAHDEKGEYKAGDTVEIEESRPISRDKRWAVIKKIK